MLNFDPVPMLVSVHCATDPNPLDVCVFKQASPGLSHHAFHLNGSEIVLKVPLGGLESRHMSLTCVKSVKDAPDDRVMLADADVST